MSARLLMTCCVSVCLSVCVVATSAGPAASVDASDLLDRQECLNALAAVRHVKWFHVRQSLTLTLSL